VGIEMVLELATAMNPDRLLVGTRADGLTGDRLSALSAGGGRVVRGAGARTLAFVGVNGPAFPVAVFAAARAGVPVAPLNYRLSADALRGLVARLDAPLVVADSEHLASLAGCDAVEVVDTGAWLARAAAEGDGGGEGDGGAGPAAGEADPDAPAVLLFTSGTTAEPKCVVLRPENLLSYVLSTVEAGSAEESDAALVSVPPYHIAGTGTVLTNLHAGRRLLYLPSFTPRAWLDLVRAEGVTSAMVVPTMLARVVDQLDGAVADTPTLRSLAYGGARMPRPVLERALRAFPNAGFVNAYGLTETSSTIALLGPEDHRAALAADDPAVRRRLGSVGRPVPGVQTAIRDPAGVPLPPGEVGELWVRGPQVSGEYVGLGSVLDEDGWFPTRDRAWSDDDGYLFIEGRSDDVIIRGGENIAPAEVEDVLLSHPGVAQAAVIGVPDVEWGERLVAVVVPARGSATGSAPEAAELREWVRARLRSSKTPDTVVFRAELPQTDTSKLLRRVLVAELAGSAAVPARPV
jgi:acyl-CoA synthetase (AMP-forming)/AMP-acid ligase II